MRFDFVYGTGGIGTGMFFTLAENRTLGREETRLAHLTDFRDYCKGHIILHYIAVLARDCTVYPIGKVGRDHHGAGLLDEMENSLGLARARDCHIHFSIIEFTKGGEKRHRTFADPGGFGPDWEPLCHLLCQRGYHPAVICESRGTQVDDSLFLRDVYGKCRKHTVKE